MPHTTFPPAFPPAPEDPAETARRAAIAAAAAEEIARRRALPCFSLAEERRLNAAVDACEAAGALPTCESYQRARKLDGIAPHQRSAAIRACPRYAEAARVEMVRHRLENARVPEVHILTILRSMPLRLVAGAPLPVPMEERDSLRYVREFLDDEEAWILLLIGDTSVGKSGAAAWALAQSDGGLWVTARELGDVSEEAKDLRRRALAARFLVIDDIGVEHDGKTSFSVGVIAGVIEARYDACAPTILTSNGKPEALADRYKERVIERLRHDGMLRKCEGASLREGSAR